MSIIKFLIRLILKIIFIITFILLINEILLFITYKYSFNYYQVDFCFEIGGKWDYVTNICKIRDEIYNVPDYPNHIYYQLILIYPFIYIIFYILNKFKLKRSLRNN